MGLMLFLEAISLYGESYQATYLLTGTNISSDHYYKLTTAYWVVFTLLLIATILLLAVGQVKFDIKLKASIQTLGFGSRCGPTPWELSPMITESFGMLVTLIILLSAILTLGLPSASKRDKNYKG